MRWLSTATAVLCSASLALAGDITQEPGPLVKPPAAEFVVIFIEGIGEVEVGSDFLSLSVEEQQEAVDVIDREFQAGRKAGTLQSEKP